MNLSVIGVLIIAIAGYLFTADYSLSLTGRVKEYKSIVQLLEFIASSLSSSSEPIGDIVNNFLKRGHTVSNYISKMYSFKNGRFELVREPSEERDTLLSQKDREKIKKTFSEYGRYGIDEQRRILSDAKAHFVARLREVEAESEKNKKAAGLIFVALFVGAFILVV